MITLVVLFMTISLIIILGLVNPTVKNIRVANDLYRSKQSLFLSDSGVADAIYRLKNNLQISGQEFLIINNQWATTSIVDTMDGKTVTATGNYADYFRNIETKISKGTGISFYYGVQTGQGGFVMSGSSQVNGNIYSNGPISGGTVTGSAISATTTTVGISDVKIGTDGVGDAWAHNVKDSTIQGNLKCQIGSGNKDGKGFLKDCNTASPDPRPVAMPISAEQIAEWKAEASISTTTGNYSPDKDVSLGPVHITGDLEVKKTIIMTGTIWVGGTLSFNGTQAKIILATSTYGTKSGIIMVDKYATFSGGSQIQSTGATSSYVMLLITSDCPVSSFCNKNPAISASGGAGSVVLAAPYGTISFGGNSSARGVVADKVEMGGSTAINYEYGLADQNFVSGPTGSYTVSSFRETE